MIRYKNIYDILYNKDKEYKYNLGVQLNIIKEIFQKFKNILKQKELNKINRNKEKRKRLRLKPNEK